MSRLQMLSPPSGAENERALTQPQTILGRGGGADWAFDDGDVSRRHAVVHHGPGRDEIEDLGSLAGTHVNGRLIQVRQSLHDGDIIQLATVRLRYAGTDNEGPATSVATTPVPEVSFEIDAQRAGVISNVGGAQYNHYVQQVIVKREDAFTQIESMGRVSRALSLFGMSVFFVGLLGFMGSILFEGAISDPDVSSYEAFEESTAFAEVFGVPVFALAMGVALVGFAFLITGNIIQAAATTRTRQVDRRYPLPPGWGGTQT